MVTEPHLYSSEDKEMIAAAYQQLKTTIASKMDEKDERDLDVAIKMATDSHAKQRRKSGEPYILHPIAVAQICAEEIELGPTAVIAALLHDTVEDTYITLEDIETQFSPKMAAIVNGLTKLDKAYDFESHQAENFKKVLSTLLDDVRIALIKMADRLHNMRTLGSMPPHKQLKIASETQFVYAPLAHRLGLNALKTEFEDLCMKIRQPELYQDITAKIKNTEGDRQNYVEEFIKPIKKELDEAGLKYRIMGRTKSIFSISKKLKAQQIPFENIYDLFAIRIILDIPPKAEKSTCWLIYSTVTDIYQPIPERLKDWVTTPKANGYESLHTTVVGLDGRFVEVQIRSERMDAIAERGFAAHWKYKKVDTTISKSKPSTSDVFDRWLDSIKDMIDSKEESNALEFLSEVKANLFKREVYVYTPNGDMRILPNGATALDFAFDIHSQVGYNCTAIKVNNKLVPMGYVLQHGDQVSVTTNKSQKPSEGWLKMVITSKAKNKIRNAMKEERKKKGVFGKEALERRFKNLKIDFEDNVEILTKYFGYKSRIDLYYALAMEEISIPDIAKHFVVEDGLLVEKVKETPNVIPNADTDNTAKKISKATRTKGQLVINGEDSHDLAYEFAPCCNPVQGDLIFAYMSGNGLKIHRSSCPNSTQLMASFGDRIMKAEWASKTDSNFVADLVIVGVDSGVGVIQLLSNKISSMGLNMRAFHIDGNQGYFEAKISLFVKNTNQLNLVIKELKEMEGIQSVGREE